MTAPPARPDVVTIGSLTDLAAAVPHLLGFHPTESLVAVALRGRRERMSFTMRLDLQEPERDDAVAAMCADRMVHARASAVLLAVYTSAPPRPGLLPRAPLVESVQHRLAMPLRDALLVADGRVWSYLCTRSRCCPPEGMPLQPDSGGAVALAAAHALQGNVVLPDRDALVATTMPVRGVAGESMRQAIQRAFAGFTADAEDGELVESSLALVDRMCARYADPPASLTHDEAAALAVRVHHALVRDALLSRVARGDDTAVRLVADLARLAQPPFDAPAATMLAMAGYLRGDGVVAVAAAERALASDPDDSLAHLLLDAIGRQLDPKHIRRIWSGYRR